ncbi:hypothetical protein A33O_19304 [Nitratireductor aquibiodomus RA22]|uniref:ApbE family lipoprotein n=1 Tax=Nitratireductor aquibiodomus RA22 TaxID=1189611 RepID=I5BSJ2_9HYPH|nr:UPF0280 family protein [Nitratireductor aquibiodomus]EIM72544.1 hypothetical protein A33O_19304 [Nitratireductor aquibiodomus RA22]
MSGATASWLADGGRLHLNHGPIDLIVEAFGEERERFLAYRQAVARFETILEELVAELPALRSPAGARARRFSGSTAQRMEEAVHAHLPAFVTPMAAVAGSVADEVLAALVKDRAITRAYVNNGGDIAIHLADGESLDIAIAGTGHGLADRISLSTADPVRGIATSGWRGRSHSLGIADAVTVLACSAAAADVAATLIANDIDLPGHPAVKRVPANEIDPDSDLRGRLVTQAVGCLSDPDVARALENGLSTAWAMRERGLIEAAALFLRGETRECGTISLGKLAYTAVPAVPSHSHAQKGLTHA